MHHRSLREKQDILREFWRNLQDSLKLDKIVTIGASINVIFFLFLRSIFFKIESGRTAPRFYTLCALFSFNICPRIFFSIFIKFWPITFLTSSLSLPFLLHGVIRPMTTRRPALAKCAKNTKSKSRRYNSYHLCNCLFLSCAHIFAQSRICSDSSANTQNIYIYYMYIIIYIIIHIYIIIR